MTGTPTAAADPVAAAPIAHGGRLFRKYLLLIIALVSVTLLVSSGIGLYFSCQENRAALASLQREKAIGASSRIIALAAQHRLPAMYEWGSQVEGCGLMSCGSRGAWIAERVAGHVDRIFKGAKPADMPVEQPTKFEWVVNLKTAKALGLVIPQAVLLRADEVIQ